MSRFSVIALALVFIVSGCGASRMERIIEKSKNEFITKIDSYGAENRQKFEAHLREVAVAHIGEGRNGKYKEFFKSNFKAISKGRFETDEEFYARWPKIPTDVFYSTSFVILPRGDSTSGDPAGYNLAKEEFYFCLMDGRHGGDWGFMRGLGVEMSGLGRVAIDKIEPRTIVMEKINNYEILGMAFARDSIPNSYNYGARLVNLHLVAGLNGSLIEQESDQRLERRTKHEVWKKSFRRRPFFRFKVPRDEAKRTNLRVTYGIRFRPDWVVTKYTDYYAAKFTKETWGEGPLGEYHYANADLISLVIYDDVTKKVYRNCIFYTPEELGSFVAGQPSDPVVVAQEESAGPDEREGSKAPEPVAPKGEKEEKDPKVAIIEENLAKLRSSDKEVKQTAVVFIRQIDSSYAPAIQTLTTALADENQTVRAVAAYALGKIGPAAKSAVPKMKELLEDPHPGVQKYARQALGKIEAEQ